MEIQRLDNLRTLARKLQLPPAWLKAEALAGRLPCLKVGRQLRFNPAAVEAVLAQRAATVAPSTEGSSDE